MSHDGRKWTPAAVVRHREEKIIAWRGKGVKLRVMAERLKVSMGVVGRLAARLIAQGRMKSKWSTYSNRQDPTMAQMSSFRKRLMARDQQIVALRAEGCSILEISRRLGTQYRTTHFAVRSLVRRGQMPKPKRHPGVYGPKSAERVAVIIKMKKQRATLRQIGDVLGLTRERVRQIARRIVRDRGAEVFKPNSMLWSAKEAAEIVGCDYEVVLRLCQRGVVPSVQTAPSRRRLLNQGSMNALVEWLRKTQESPVRVCSNCGVEFAGRRKKACSQKCYSRLRYLARRDLTPEQASGWRGAVWQALQGWVASESEEWLVVGEACRRSGLTNMQLKYLGQAQLVAVKLHPTRKWRNFPCRSYAASQMEVVARVYREFQRAERRRKRRRKEAER